MNTSIQMMEQGSPTSTVSALGTAMEYKLPKAGSRPLIFNGSELAMAMSFTPGLPYWYEINLYHSDAQDYIVAIRKFYQSETEADQVNSWSFSDVESAMSHIEQYDPASSVNIPEIDPTEMAAAEMSAMALSLKAEVDSVRNHYAGLVGELFMEMEAVENSIGQ